MAGTNKKAPTKKKSGARSTTAQTKHAEPARGKSAEPSAARTVLDQLMPFILIVCTIFLLVCLIFNDAVGVVGGAISYLMRGLLAAAAYAIPVLLLYHAFTYRKNAENGTRRMKIIFSFVLTILLSVFFHLILGGTRELSVGTFYTEGADYIGGGFFGGILGTLLCKLFGVVGTMIIVCAALFVSVLLLIGITPRTVWVYFAYRWKTASMERQSGRAEAESKTKPRVPLIVDPSANVAVAPAPQAEPPVSGGKFDPDVPLDEEAAAATSSESTRDEEAIFAEVMQRTRERMAETGEKEADIFREQLSPERSTNPETLADDELDLRKIFVNPENIALINQYRGSEEEGGDAADVELGVEKHKLDDELATHTPTPIAEPADEIAPPEYHFPPITLLTRDTAQKNVDVRAELQENAAKLVETLRSFNVKTKIIDVSRGPTITRYELSPEAGTRVRSILNLVDDIALNLATTGVRIEAPIAGKSAVGIEVPNKTCNTVHVRELIENKQFTQAKSKLTACLGEDVAGTPVYLDIARMPHLLIAGATGMGKSVCINSIIVSLLYKARPDEVKLILIDPKKVELNIYNGIPHLLVPVVSDPKKAAGSLHWAVTEMERRFELIEAVGVRDIANYNAITADDPDKEFMPQVVIIIDELADLMMTAPDDVEESICRLAQKARAAGMHLIIGTQRPSVDVITGLIKSNIPSRIAFTVASQVDSRTIIDIAGAEKLIGRGDMLYAPVGAPKPIRVQGSFVSESEVESVIDFIKAGSGQTEYDHSVIETIEKEAALCGTGKRNGTASLDDDGEADPMLRSAIELAIESGKISTSLIQRRLSLGYGRAAKLIDKMETLGYVSPPEGQKPREVLITRQQYMEMVLRDEDSVVS